MDALEQYIHDHTSPEEELLHELDRATNLRVVQPRMLSGHIQDTKCSNTAAAYIKHFLFFL